MTRTGRRFSILFVAIAALAKTGSAAARREFFRSALVLAAVALLALSGSLALPAAAQAQTATTFVSNIEEVQLRGNVSIQAQRFITGSNTSGYTLSEVVLRRVSGGQGSATYVKVRRGTASAPGDASSDLVANLSTPGGSSLVASFTAPANTTLAANTFYWVVVNEGRGSRMSVGGTESDGQTDTAEDPDWGIAHERLWKNSDSDAWGSSSIAVMIAIKGFTAESAPPTLTAAEVASSGDVIELGFDKDLDLPSTIPSALKDAFSVTADGSAVAISSITKDGSSGLKLNLSSLILQGMDIVVSYDESDAGTNALDNDAGNKTADFTTGIGGVPAVTNNSTQVRPTLTAAEVSTDGRMIALTFSENLDHPTYTTTIRGAFTVTVDGTGIGVIGATGGMNKVDLSVSTMIGGGQAVVVSYDQSDAGSEALAHPGGLNVLDFTTGRGGIPAVVNNSEVDLSPPALTGGMVTSSGVAIELAFDEDLELPATIPAALKDAFSVTVDGDTVAISSLAADGSSGLGPAPSWAVLGEGLFDWLALAGWGLPACAALGTQGVEKAAASLRGCPRVFLAFDRDDAGREAAERLGGLLGRRAAAVNLPGGIGDVAELAAMPHGRAAFLRLLARAAHTAR